MSGQTGVSGEDRTNLSFFRERVPSNMISEFVINSNSILCHRVSGGPPYIVVLEFLKAFVLRRNHGYRCPDTKGGERSSKPSVYLIGGKE
jgi:hypothetical protein